MDRKTDKKTGKKLKKGKKEKKATQAKGKLRTSDSQTDNPFEALLEDRPEDSDEDGCMAHPHGHYGTFLN